MAKKLYYKIGEACKRLDIQPYVLRYWETEFPVLTPSKSKSGQRVYSEADLQIIQRIKELLYEEGYTIAGAKKKLEGEDLSNLAELREQPKPATPPKAEKATPKAKSEVSEASAAAVAGKAAPKSKSPKSPAKKPARKPVAVARDSDSDAELKKLRKGVRAALKDARALLDSLDRL